MKNKNIKYKILIIDKNKEFNTKLYFKLKKYNYELFQSFDEKQVFKIFLDKNHTFDLIILNINFREELSTKIFNHIKQNSSSKIIILNNKETELQREEYFKQGILDYHMTSKNIDHIVGDIRESLERLNTNKQETILIIDDSKLVCSMLKKVLEEHNYNILIAYNAQDGFDIIKNNDISLLLLDMELPDIHGLDILNKLRDLNFLDNFLVMVIS
jgi:DNA-binding response OmpR family regulator